MSDTLVTVAFCIGNEDSCTGYSFLHEYYADPLRIRTIIDRNSTGSLCFTTPTCVLFTKDKVFHSFGYESKENYLNLLEDEEHKDWYFFERFLSSFTRQERPLSESTNFKDVHGKEMLAIDVISTIIKGLIFEVFKEFEMQKCYLRERDIRWVLCIPASWHDDARWFWKAATKAGIDDDQLLLVSEEEAAVLLCKHLHMKRDGIHDMNLFSVGSKYIVLNCKDEAAFLTVFKVNADFSLKELYKSRETSGGVNQVYKAYSQLLTDIFGAPVLTKVSRSYPEDYDDMYAELKRSKNNIKYGENKKITVRVPFSLVEVFEEDTGKNVQKSIDNSKYHSKIWLMIGNRLRFSEELVTDLFTDPCNEIIALVNTALKIPEIKGTKNIFMIGEFAEFRILKDIIKQALPEMEIVNEPDAKLSGLKGAVIYGHEHRKKPKYISSRVAKFIGMFKKGPVLRV